MPMAVLVVFIHFNLAKNSITANGIEYIQDYPAWFDFVVTLISSVLSGIAIPLFFFFSGFLFFKDSEFSLTVYIHKLRSRAKTLLIPYLMWNFIAILNNIVKMLPPLSKFFPGADSIDIQISLKRLLYTFFANNNINGIFVSSGIGEDRGLASSD